ncbi:hypothetical protein A3B57_04245 [Microgenomates group bacterium RIFCSPLOWO2_01_FULL_47_10]|nr:MAG: hypothetical protein A3B57_04245 [Microgenomates group bacterium RIFCSPLOWO2_01_FULL_47_10]
MPEQLTGTIYSFGIVGEAERLEQNVPASHESLRPYAEAIVDVDLPDVTKIKRMTMRVTDMDPNRSLSKQLRIGQKGEVITRRMRDAGEQDILVYGYVLRLFESERITNHLG